MRYVISGAAGFIGSHLCELLLEEGHSVVGLDNFITGSTNNIEHLRQNPKFELHEVDVTHSFEVGGNINVVMHLASLASPKDYLAHPLQTLNPGLRARATCSK